MRVLALKVTPEGIFRYRSEVQLEGMDYTIVNPSEKWVEDASSDPPDAVHVSYSGSPDLLAEMMALRHLRRVPFVVDCDDLFTSVPDYNQSGNAVHPGSPAYRMRVAMLKAASVVTVSTPTLGRMLHEQMGIEPRVVPNFVKPEWFEAPKRERTNGKTRIMLTSASGGHWGDLEFIKPVIIEFAARPDIEFCIFGSFPEWALPYPNIHAIRWAPVKTYFGLLRHLNADIGLAPLLPNDFNRCKSGIKYYEYALAGAVGVYSDLEPYSEVRHGATGLVVPHDVTSWRAALSHLIGNSASRACMAANAKADVLAHHTTGGALERVIQETCGTLAPKEAAHALS